MGSRCVKGHDDGDGQAREMRVRPGGWGGAGTWTGRVREEDAWAIKDEQGKTKLKLRFALEKGPRRVADLA